MAGKAKSVEAKLKKEIRAKEAELDRLLRLADERMLELTRLTALCNGLDVLSRVRGDNNTLLAAREAARLQFNTAANAYADTVADLQAAE